MMVALNHGMPHRLGNSTKRLLSREVLIVTAIIKITIKRNIKFKLNFLNISKPLKEFFESSLQIRQKLDK
jgi:uncharacterized membrane protein